MNSFIVFQVVMQHLTLLVICVFFFFFKLRHSGDLGNIEAGEDGVAKVDITDKQIPLTGVNSIIGRSLVASIILFILYLNALVVSFSLLWEIE